MDRPSDLNIGSSKPSLSQQLLRTFRPRASTTAAPFTSSATASPISTPIDHSLVGELSNASDSLDTFGSVDILDRSANLFAKAETLTSDDYKAYINDLSIPIQAEGGPEEEEIAIADRLQKLQILIYAINRRIDQETDESKTFGLDSSAIPPQAAIIELCLLLLASAKEGILPLPLRLGACELTTASVKLSDIRASKVLKAVRETRSGAPGSQSSKVPDADLPLANIDRAALYDLVCHLSDGYEADLPTKDNWHQSQLPALPVQLKALEVLSHEGRDVTGFPNILDFLGQALELIWKELQILRRLQRERRESRSEEDSIKLIEQLSAREWSMQATLQLITSIVKCGFAILDGPSLVKMLDRIASIFLHASIDNSVLAAEVNSRIFASRGRSKSREKKPLTEGYDYYGIEHLSSIEQTPSASPTPRMSNTPRLGPRVIDSSSIAPIALATLAPASTNGQASSSNVDGLRGQPILQQSDVKAVMVLFDTIIRFGSIPSASIDSVVQVISFVLGYQDSMMQLQDSDDGVNNDWTKLVAPVLENILRGHCANAALRSILRMLKEPNEMRLGNIVLLVGGIAFLRNALYILAREVENNRTTSLGGESGKKASDNALAPCLTLSLLLPALEGALQRHKDILDLHVLRLVSDMLPLEGSTGKKEVNRKRLFVNAFNVDEWDSLLDLTVLARRHVIGWRLRGNAKDLFGLQKKKDLDGDGQTSKVVLAMLDLVGHLRLGPPDKLEESHTESKDVNDIVLPWTPKLAALLLSLAPILPDHLIEDLIIYYKAHDLCLPSAHDWISNIRSLLAAFFHRQESSKGELGPPPVPLARRSLCSLIFEHVYEIIQDIDDYRCTLMLDVILPLSQAILVSETDPVIESTIRLVLVESAAMAISRVSLANLPDVEAEIKQSASHEATKTTILNRDQKIFDDVCDLFDRTARSTNITPTEASALISKDAFQPHVTFNDPPGSHDHRSNARVVSSSAQDNGHAINGDLPADESSSSPLDKHSRSALDLIGIFHKLAFSSPWALLPLSSLGDRSAMLFEWERVARDACLTIFRRLLAIIRPGPREVAPATIRLTILQWMVRLRTDRQHRVYLAENLDELIAPAATYIGRGLPLNSKAVPNSKDEASVNGVDAGRSNSTIRKGPEAIINREGGRGPERGASRAERSISRVRDASRDRGRKDQSPRIGTDRDRSSSRNRATGNVHTSTRRPTGPDALPLWRLPEQIHFEVPGSRLRSDVVYTYMHPEWESCDGGQHRQHHAKPPQESGDNIPVALPVSEYVATCIELIQLETEWDLISYLLCHLPHQLANKHLFCGPKAQRQIISLHEALTTSILDQKFVNQVTLPEKVKKSDVYAIAYGTLTTLISYHALFSRSQQDALVEAFMTGLNKSGNTAQPCVRALSVACYELQKSINRYLPKILNLLTTVMSSPAMSVHILELLAAIGNLPSLYANFTEGDYKRIFSITLQYIQFHNQDRQSREQEGEEIQNVTSFTLSQYVLMLAYYNIALWFISLRFHDRLKHVESIRKGLLAANVGRDQISDQTEVCFDFLARFSYSTANPRPKQSYLNKVIKASAFDPLSKTYIYGKSLVTFTSFDKFGGAEVILRRSSGTLAMTCKIENAFASQLPREDGEKLEVLAALMMERRSDASSSSSKKEWSANQLHLADVLSRHGARGPPQLGGVRPMKRSASFSEGDPVTQNRLSTVCLDVDAYSTPLDADERADTVGGDVEADERDAAGERVKEKVVKRESARISESLREILGITELKENIEAEEKEEDTIKASKEFLMDPGYLALQLSSFPDLNDNAPILLPNEASTQRLIRSIDLTPVVDFHKIGVLYVGSGQMKEKEILGNRSGSRNYTAFLAELGELVTLKGQQDVYTGGLDIRNDEHGKYAYVWGDDISQIVFHVTTLMPNHLHDENHSGKKALIGNDWVRIVWNESGREYDFDTIKTQFNFINVVISPTSRGGGEVGSVNAADTLFYRVSLQTIEGLPNFSPVGDGQLISAANLAPFVRIMALNSNLVSQIFVAATQTESGSSYTYTSNWVSRLHHIERARAKVEAIASASSAAAVTSSKNAESSSGNDGGVNGSTSGKASGGVHASHLGKEGNLQKESIAYDIARF